MPQNTTECHICHRASTHDNAAWCPGCTGEWQADLAFIATQWTELATAETKQARFCDIGAKILGRTTPLPFNPAAQDCRAQAIAVLAGWADDLGCHPIPTDVRALTAWLSIHAVDARTHPAATDIWAEVHALTQQLLHVIDRPADREYLGDCTSPQCADKAYAITCPTGAAVAICRHCRVEYDAQSIREQRRRHSDDQLVTQAELESVYPRRTVAGWIRAGSLLAHGTKDGKPTYRLGDARALRAINAKHGRRHANLAR
ncbi:MAG: hypothetical protein LBV00_10315 [Propionibacteriaceae bacterium]|jgi:hypothetical protein|nr:hypothetical protein [Propionibacteriaceae bacterium]